MHKYGDLAKQVAAQTPSQPRLTPQVCRPHMETPALPQLPHSCLLASAVGSAVQDLPTRRCCWTMRALRTSLPPVALIS